jgi:hypothetical protein
MSWRFHGRARVNSGSPEAFAACDRCSFWYARSDLAWQFEWRGNELKNTQLLVCKRTCLDVPFEHYRPIVVPPDPVPLMNPRPDQNMAVYDVSNNLLDTNLELITDTNGVPLGGTETGNTNVPPYPFAGFTMLRADGGGPVAQIAVRDDAYAIQVRNDVQEQLPPGATPQFSTTPATNPNRGYNNLNILNNRPGQTANQYAFPVVVDIPEE